MCAPSATLTCPPPCTVLHFGTLTPKSRKERLRVAELVLKHAPQRPRGTYPQLAVRYAANTLAWDIYSREATRGRGRPMFEVLDGKTLTSTTMTEVFQSSELAPAYQDLKKSAEADMPTLIEFPLFAAANANAVESVSEAEARKQRATKAVAKWLKREPEQRFYESDDD